MVRLGLIWDALIAAIHTGTIFPLIWNGTELRTFHTKGSWIGYGRTDRNNFRKPIHNPFHFFLVHY